MRARPIPSLFREFSAPVHVHSDLTRGGPALPDRTRSRSLQPLGGGAADRAFDAGSARPRRSAPSKRPQFDPRFAEELGRLAANDELDPAFRALALCLPSETDVAQAIAPRRRSRRDPRRARARCWLSRPRHRRERRGGGGARRRPRRPIRPTRRAPEGAPSPMPRGGSRPRAERCPAATSSPATMRRRT